MQPLYKNEKQLFMDFQDFLNPGFIFRHPREKEKRGTHRTCSVLHNRPVLLVDSPCQGLPLQVNFASFKVSR